MLDTWDIGEASVELNVACRDILSNEYSKGNSSIRWFRMLSVNLELYHTKKKALVKSVWQIEQD